jgi:hypothetical protein
MLLSSRRRDLYRGFGAVERKPGWRPELLAGWIGLLCGFCFAAFGTATVLAASPTATAISIADLQNAALSRTNFIERFRLNGTVCATAPQQGLLALQDATGTVLLQLPAVDEALRAGDQVLLQGTNCVIKQTRYSIEITPTLLIDNDGVHAPITKSASTFLPEGFQRFRLEWFNGTGPETLSLEYEGPQTPRQIIPDSAYWHKREGAETFQAGLEFGAYNGFSLAQLPDFIDLPEVTNGVASRPDLAYAARPLETALAFSGYIQVPVAGNYTFYLTSDDGGKLWVGTPAISVVTIAPGPSVFPRISLEKALADRSHDQWVQVEGETVFAGSAGPRLEIELAGKGNRVAVTVLDGSALFSTNVLHRRVRLEGICEFSRNDDEKEFSEFFRRTIIVR